MLGKARAGMPSHVTADLAEAQIRFNDDEMRDRTNGNLCLCSAYPNVVAAITDMSGARV